MLLLAIGVVMVFSASFIRAQQSLLDPYYYLKRQVMWMLIGTVAMAVVSFIPYWHWRRIAVFFLYVSILCLVAVLIPGVGTGAFGSQRWIGIGPIGFQPSELSKLAIVVFLSHHLTKKQKLIKQFGPVFIPALAALGVSAGLILRQPDLGTTIAIGLTAWVVLLAAGTNGWYLTGLTIAALPLAYYFATSEEYRMRRLLAFLDPQADPLGTGYQIIQSLYALGSGGLFGVGFFDGRQKFFYLPAQHTDFIFAVLGEELGFIGTFAVLALFAALAWRGFRIAIAAPDTFACLLAVGLTSMVVLQAVINIGVVTASLPITGISLPFISYGGSSLIFTMVGMGILLNISKYSRV